jgi:hypothetical protein
MHPARYLSASAYDAIATLLANSQEEKLILPDDCLDFWNSFLDLIN